jgi:ferredoxin
VGPRSYEETAMLRDLASFDAHRSRLSCQITVTPAHDGLAVTIGPEE